MNPKYKNAVNDCVKIIAFMLAFLLVLEGLSLSVFSGRSAAKFSARLRDAYSFVDEPDDTIQIACIGNSNMYSGFVPFQLWNDYGYTSTVCASPFQSVEESLGLMEKMYKTQSPKLVLVETDMFYGSYPKKIPHQSVHSRITLDLQSRIISRTAFVMFFRPLCSIIVGNWLIRIKIPHL